MNNDMRCPTNYYVNCKNSSRKCKSCAAFNGNTSLKLKYEPVKSIAELMVHPMQLVISDEQKNTQIAKRTETNEVVQKRKAKKSISTMIKKALDVEIKVLSRLANKAGLPFNKTLRSGAINGDGDGSIGPCSLDHKHRTTSKSFTVSGAEWDKGLAQGVNAWALTNKNNDTAILITEELFVELLICYKQCQVIEHTESNS